MWERVVWYDILLNPSLCFILLQSSFLSVGRLDSLCFQQAGSSMCCWWSLLSLYYCAWSGAVTRCKGMEKSLRRPALKSGLLFIFGNVQEDKDPASIAADAIVGPEPGDTFWTTSFYQSARNWIWFHTARTGKVIFQKIKTSGTIDRDQPEGCKYLL